MTGKNVAKSIKQLYNEATKEGFPMKRLFLILMALILSISVFGCQKEIEKDDNSDEASTNSESSEVSDEKPIDKYPEATKLISEGKFEDAYKLLYAAREDEDARKMLKSFVWIAKKTTANAFDTEGSETVYKLDENGNILEKIMTYSGGGSEKTTFRYDEKGRILEERFYWNGNAEYSQTMQYDDYGNVIKREYVSDGFTRTEVADVENGLVVKRTITTDFGTSEEILTYDENNHLSVIETVENGIKQKTSSLVYDKDGKILKEVYHGIYDFTTEYFYDEKGILVKIETYDTSSDNKNSTEFVFDDDGKKIKTIEKNFGEESVTEYFYDELGRLTKSLQDPENGGLYFEENYSDYVCFYKG
jgi:YD repeat-containing protein